MDELHLMELLTWWQRWMIMRTARKRYGTEALYRITDDQMDHLIMDLVSERYPWVLCDVRLTAFKVRLMHRFA